MINPDSAIIGLINPKNVSNVGAVVRASHCFAADRIIYTGIRYDRAARFHTDTRNASSVLAMQHTVDIFEPIPTGYQVICVELAVGATALAEFSHPARAAYLFGPEDGTLSQDIIDRAHSVVFVPTRGSLNLAASVNVVLYDRQSKQSDQSGRDAHDKLIRESRDNRNRLKVSNSTSQNHKQL